MRLVLLGPPGAGKGTQADVLSNRLKIPHISTGDELREALREKKDVGKRAKEYMEKGDLVPDELVTEIVKDRLSRDDVKKGFILDGYPRTEKQAEDLDRALNSPEKRLDLVIYFKTSPAVSIERLSGRRICRGCNANYHTKNIPPAIEGICDKCGKELYQRKDDKKETVVTRLEVYIQKTKSLIEYYEKKGLLREVPGDFEVESLYNFLVGLFKKEKLA